MSLLRAIILMTAFAPQPNPAMLRGVFEDALTRRQEQFGTFDPRTAQAARDLGLFLKRQGDTVPARNLLDQVVRIDEQLFGPNDPQTLADVAELAAVSEPGQAEVLWRRAADASNASVAVQALEELGRLSAIAGNPNAAASFYRRALAKQEAGHVENSAAFALDLNALAKLVAPEEAIRLLDRALAIDRGVLGPRHAETATTAANLAGLLADTPRNEEAIRLAGEALATFRQTLGPDHRRTALAASILAYALEVKGDRRQAEQMYRLAMRIDERALGPRDQQTLNDARVLEEFLKSAPTSRH